MERPMRSSSTLPRATPRLEKIHAECRFARDGIPASDDRTGTGKSETTLGLGNGWLAGHSRRCRGVRVRALTQPQQSNCDAKSAFSARLAQSHYRGRPMRRRHRDEKPVFAARGAVTRAVVGLSDSPDYWPLTVEPTASRRKRSVSTWMFLGVIVAL